MTDPAGEADLLDAWLAGGAAPPRSVIKEAVKESLAALAERAPGHSVEVRIPPYAAIQCIEGPRHTRGTPPNIVETDARTWLALATGRLNWTNAVGSGTVSASGSRAPEVGALLPLR
ncbi:sterol carrier family protein [Pseudonocardia kujensis]|uniref:sterol carrier family protein n=1 Tax=Pseudonocardia kujensis TaxID=1128675 RepID=UPI001E466DBB|nr:sterol carrier family protein [Pseudonocardia kujensis]MCE0765852.1 sterol carrier family protein [Pseudonocardia kujensis]